MSSPISRLAVGHITSRPPDPADISSLGWRRTCKHMVRDPIAWLLLGPLAWFVAFWTMVAAAVVINGEWPQPRTGFPGMPEYERPSLSSHWFGPVSILLFFALMTLFVTVPLGAGHSLIAIGLKRVRRRKWMYAAFVISSMLVYLTLALDPGGAIFWFAD
jgi:hypothetical protein